MINFKDISYLKKGNKKQIESYNILTKIDIFNILKEYRPILVGTIPLEIDTENSDLDIVCQVYDFEEFKQILQDNFSTYRNFKIINKDTDIIVCNFIEDNMEIEIYASNIESDKSNGYRHMIIEYKLLKLYGDQFKEEVIKLKREGLKTEPAFAKMLNLNGDPYEKLLEFEKSSYNKIKGFFIFLFFFFNFL